MFRTTRLVGQKGLFIVGVALMLMAGSVSAFASSSLEDIGAEGPVLVTSSGQSPDAMIVKLIVDQLGLPGTQLNEDGSPEVVDGFQTLIVAIGGSMKGLGAAGIDTDGEVQRVDEMIARAKEQGALVVSIHAGGHARRGSLADPFIHGAVPKSDVVVVLADGNQDGLFNELTPEGVPMKQVDTLGDLTPLLQQLFGQ